MLLKDRVDMLRDMTALADDIATVREGLAGTAPNDVIEPPELVSLAISVASRTRELFRDVDDFMIEHNLPRP